MRPIPFLILVTFFVALPTFLTFFAFSSVRTSPEPVVAGIPSRPSRLRALFSFTTPSSLFPPSAVISLTTDNSTFFLARPAAFGPALPSHGLSGQLWVGKGFGEALSEDDIKVRGYELGCSDVPGWSEEYSQKQTKIERPAGHALKPLPVEGKNHGKKTKHILPKRQNKSPDGPTQLKPKNDGTDDHLHYPLSDSSPARSGEPGEPANADPDRTQKPTHADIESLQEGADIAGKIVMLSRGGCGFLEKVKWAQRRGGLALIVGDNQPGGPLTIMYAKGDTSNVTIPSLFTSYNAANLLSSLVPAQTQNDETVRVSKDTVVTEDPSGNSDKHANSDSSPDTARVSKTTTREKIDSRSHKSAVQNILSAIGFSGSHSDDEDSRRPPSSGDMNWAPAEHLAESKATATTSKVSMPIHSSVKTMPRGGTASKPQPDSDSQSDDDFVIGIDDWRDTDMIQSRSTAYNSPNEEAAASGRNTKKGSATENPNDDTLNTLEGGSIVPGSGEYHHHVADPIGPGHDAEESTSRRMAQSSRPVESLSDKLRSIFHPDKKPADHGNQKHGTIVKPTKPKHSAPIKNPNKKPKERQGLWVTLTPTSYSTTPFFDTLLVLVVSPLVTLTVVYGLLLLRSRIRRRRWRAPKSIVEQLPVRIYQTMTSSSSTATSSQVSTPSESAQPSPQMRPASSQSRPRSQTAIGVVNSGPEKKNSTATKRKTYSGRQIECVVCLEDYVDGESRVMSLPCGHEFHAECITPWLVTRRRTCPICKGDVVRSFSRSAAHGSSSVSNEDMREDGEQTADDVQTRAATTTNEEASAAIPIPVREGEISDEDVEQGDVSTPLLREAPSQSQGWRGVLGASISRLSGDTLWRSTPNDRSR